MIPKSRNQLTDTVLMIEPVQFGFNEAAFETNSFQNKPLDDNAQTIQTKALSEFNNLVVQLKKLGVNVIVYSDTLDSFTPDAIFPNNWISTHETGELFTYPMAVENRRAERRTEIVRELSEKFNLSHNDLSFWENEALPRYLEGTGSMIFDRVHRICYAALSPRTNLSALEEFCRMASYQLMTFRAFGKIGESIYHTNVMLTIGETFVCVGIETSAVSDRNRLISSFKSVNKEIIEFTNDQIYSRFAGNMLQVRNKMGETILCMSERIFNDLTRLQKSQLERHNDYLLPADIRTIEKIGGGSVRCMLAELFGKTF